MLDSRRRMGAALIVVGMVTAIVGAVLIMTTEDDDSGSSTVATTTSMSTSSPAATSTQPDRDARVASFLDELGASFRADDRDALVAVLNPIVIERYGSDACRAYLGTVVDRDFRLEVGDVGEPAPWTWQVDGEAVSIAIAIPVKVSRVVNGRRVDQEMHLAERTDGSLTWFTDCGTPLEGGSS